MWHGHFVEHLVCNQRKKKLTPTPHIQSSKILWQRAKGWVSIYSQGRVFDPGSWHEPGPMLHREPRAMLGGIAPGSCHKPGPILRNEPGPAIKRHEPGLMPVIGPH
jgi:hypothetical protein